MILRLATLSFLLQSIQFIQFIQAQSSTNCFLPTGAVGVCAPLSVCSHLTDLIGNLQKPLPKDVGLLLRESFFCSGTGSGGIQVCCPPEGVDKREKTNVPVDQLEHRGACGLQDGRSAECVNYDICSPFIQLMANLRKPLPQSTPFLVRSSFICGKDDERNVPKVCCPSEALQPFRDQTSTPKPTTQPTMVDRFGDHPARSLLARQDTCGIPSVFERIVGGQTAAIGQYTWLVNLGYKQNNRGQNLFKCGGTLIGRQHVLTAAHCVIQLPRGFGLSVVRVGEYDLSKKDDCGQGFCMPPPQDIEIAEVVPHDMYGKPAPFQNDIAIIKLARPVVINDFVSPICLPYANDNDDYMKNRIDVDGDEYMIETEVAGWGATNKVGRDPADVLQFLPVNVTDSDNCKEIYSKRGGILTGKQICAGGEKGKDSCVGDSGSALMRSRPPTPTNPVDQWDIIGVVSFGPRLCGTEGVPGVYTRVNSYIEWILDTVSQTQ